MNLSRLIARRFSHSLRRDGFSRFTTIVSTASVALGCVALIVSMSVLNGYEELIKSTALQYTSHIEVRAVAGTSIQRADALAERIATIDGVEHVEPVIQREALAKTKYGVDGILLTSTPQQPHTTTHATVGAEVARRLGLKVGDTLLVYTADNMEVGATPTLFTLPIGGILRSGMQSIDESVIQVPIKQLATSLRMSTIEPTVLAVSLTDPESAPQIARVINAITDGSLMVITWKQRFESISSWIELQRQPIPIVLGLISIVAVFTLVSTLLVTVVEKTRSIAILATLGMTPGQLARIVLLRGLRIGFIGTAIGVGISLAFAVIQSTWQPITLDGTIYYVSALPVSLSPIPYMIVPAISIALVVMASMVPILAARRISPAQALRFA